MTYFLETRVWIKELTAENKELKRLGLENEEEETLLTDFLTIDIFRIQYFYPCTMQKKNDSTYVQFKNNQDIIVASPYQEFSKEIKDCIIEINK